MYFWEYRVTGDTKEHAKRGVDPATDFATPYGTVVHAPFAGTVESGYSDARGHWVSITSSVWGKVYICHLSKIYTRSGNVSWREAIAESGNSGYVIPKPTKSNPYNGSHVHAWVEKDGKRYSFNEWLKKFVNKTQPQKTVVQKPKPKQHRLVGRELNLPATYWYRSPLDAKRLKNVHGGKYTGEPMLIGRGYRVLDVQHGSMLVHSKANGNVWINESLKKYLI